MHLPRGHVPVIPRDVVCLMRRAYRVQNSLDRSGDLGWGYRVTSCYQCASVLIAHKTRPQHVAIWQHNVGIEADVNGCTLCMREVARFNTGP